MKKLIVGIFAVALMSFGLVGFTSTSASAACKPSEYVTCPKTTTKVAPKVTKTKKAVVRPKVAVKGSNVKAKGTVKVVCKAVKGKGGAKGAAPAGKAVKLNLPKKGAYKCTATYIGTNAQGSKDSFVVVRK